MRFLGFGRKVWFYWFSRKMSFNENICFMFFLQKNASCSFGGKVYFSVLRENTFFGYSEKM